MKKVVGPMDSTEEFDTLEDEPIKKKQKRVVKKQNRKPDKKVNKNDPRKPKKKVSRTKDWSFWAIIISLIIILVPAVYMGVTLYRAYTETGRPVIGHRFDNDLVPTIEEENLNTLQTKLESIEAVDSVKVHLTTATLRIYLELPEASDKEAFKDKALQAETILLEEFSVEDYFTASDSQLQYDYEIYAHDVLGEETVVFLLNKSSRMEAPNSQYLSDARSQEAVDEIWEIQEEKDNPTEVEDEDVGNSEDTEIVEGDE